MTNPTINPTPAVTRLLEILLRIFIRTQGQ